MQQDSWKTQDGRNKKRLQKTGNAQSCKTFFRHSAIQVFQPSCCVRSLLFNPHTTVRNRFEVIIVGCTWHSFKHFWWAASKQNESCLEGKRTAFHSVSYFCVYLFVLILTHFCTIVKRGEWLWNPLFYTFVPFLLTVTLHKTKTFLNILDNRGVARIFQRGGHTVSKWGYSPDCHVDLHSMFRLYVTCLGWAVRVVRRTSLQNSF